MNDRPVIAHAVPSYAKYGGGWYVYITGIPTFFAATIKIARDFAKCHGCELVRL